VLKVHVRDGRTLEVDLNDGSQVHEWLARFNDPAFQATITGLTVIQRGVQYSLPKPEGFRQATLTAEPVTAGKGGERVLLYADEVCVGMVVHNGQRAARVSVTKPGKRKYNPQG
jgi:hypothetical protein